MRRTRGRRQLVGALALLFAPTIQALAQATTQVSAATPPVGSSRPADERRPL